MKRLVNMWMIGITDKLEAKQTAKGSRKEQIQRQVEKTDKEIDELVVRLSSPNIV